MKIESATVATTKTGTPPSTARGAKTAEQPKSESAQDNVTLSNASTQLQALETGVSKASGFDAAKVEAIKQAISEGRFAIKPEAIADNLIASTRELLEKNKG